MEETENRKYRVSVEFNKSTGMPMLMTWHNEFGEEDAPADLPSQLRYNEKGALLYAFWKRAGKFDQPGDLPTEIYYDDETGKPYAFVWKKRDVEHREGDRPSQIFLDRKTGKVTDLHFVKNGQPFRSGGRLAYVSFDSQGTAWDETESAPVEFDGFDPKWLPDRLYPRLF